ncbi:response regulator transcription factor [Lachnospiraceae bacterium KK002]
MKKTSILVIEDEKKLLKALTDFFTIHEYQVYTAENGLEGIQQFKVHSEEISCVLLDIMLPFMDGNEVLKQIRVFSNVPVIMLTAKEEVEDQLESLSHGADNYIVKPYSLAVVKMHVEALIKRFRQEEEFLTAGNIRIEIAAHKLYVNDIFVETTPKEFELMLFFMKNEGVVLTRDHILDSIWGYHYVGDTRTIDTIVKQLRKKLGNISCIRTVYGVGYCFEGKGNGTET